MLRLKYRPVIRALARALVCAAAPLSASLAQTGDDETGGGNLGVAGAPRPKVEKDAQYYLGRGGYDVKVFFQQGQSFENIRAHVYYEPLIYLVTDESGGLRHDIRTNERRWQLIRVILRQKCSPAALGARKGVVGPCLQRQFSNALLAIVVEAREDLRVVEVFVTNRAGDLLLQLF